MDYIAYICRLEKALNSIVKRIERKKAKSFDEAAVDFLVIEEAKKALESKPKV